MRYTGGVLCKFAGAATRQEFVERVDGGELAAVRREDQAASDAQAALPLLLEESDAVRARVAGWTGRQV